MDKQLCRLCNTRHGNNESHQFPKKDKVVSKSRLVKVAEEPEKKIDKRKTVGEKFDKVSYQREYMRKRRANK